MPAREIMPFLFTAQISATSAESAMVETIIKSGVSGAVMIGLWLLVKHVEGKREASTAELVATLKAENARLQSVLEGKDLTIEKLHEALAKRVGSSCEKPPHEKPA